MGQNYFTQVSEKREKVGQKNEGAGRERCSGGEGATHRWLEILMGLASSKCEKGRKGGGGLNLDSPNLSLH